MIKEDVLNKIKEAEKGREIWLDLIERHNIKDGDYVILFPSSYDEWAYYGALYIDDFLEFKASDRAVCLCHDSEIKAYVQKNHRAEVLDFPRKSAEKLIAFYSLYMFTDSLIIISPDEPAGRSGRDIVGVKGVTVEDVVAIGIYGLKNIRGIGKSE